jgi:hypothetical protein
MLQSLILLSDDEIETVTSAVREWCRVNNCQIDSAQGHRAVTVAIDLIQTQQTKAVFIGELSSRLAPREGLENQA